MRVLRRLPHALASCATVCFCSAMLVGCHSAPSASPPATTPPGAGGSSGASTSPAGPPTSATATSGTAASGTVTPVGWSCDAVKNAQLGNETTPYREFTQVQFSDGVWSDEAGTKAEITACATGDIDGDGPDDALAVVELTPVGENAEPWTLGLWQDVNGEASFVTLLDLGDRTPVLSVDLNGAFATVVWDTRSPTDPMTTLTIRRTSVFRLVAGKLVEAGHTDAPRPAS